MPLYSFLLATSIGAVVVHAVGQLLESCFRRSLDCGLKWTIFATIGITLASALFIGALGHLGYYYPFGPLVSVVQITAVVIIALLVSFTSIRETYDPVGQIVIRFAAGLCIAPIASHVVGLRLAMTLPLPETTISVTFDPDRPLDGPDLELGALVFAASALASIGYFWTVIAPFVPRRRLS